MDIQDKKQERDQVHQIVMDGLLHEVGSKGAGQDEAFINRVMASVQETEAVDKPISSKIIKFSSAAAAIAAGIVLIIGLSIFTFSSLSTGSSKAAKNSAPFILATSSGGLIERDEKSKAIVNGERLKANDKINVFPSSSALMCFNDSSQIELGAGSVMRLKSPKTNKKSGDHTLTLDSGIINADIIREKGDESVLKIEAGNITLLAKSSVFTLINDNGLLFVKVRHGIIRVKQSDKAPFTIKNGQSWYAGNSESAAKLFADSAGMTSQLTAQVQQYEKRLTFVQKTVDELLAKLDKRKKADLCLNNRQKRKRSFMF